MTNNDRIAALTIHLPQPLTDDDVLVLEEVLKNMILTLKNHGAGREVREIVELWPLQADGTGVFAPSEIAERAASLRNRIRECWCQPSP